ncbi:hypothetical protein Golax_021427, partial [Gossypium laxum]|nr:hypothetical protein [Gossypium laxum]
MELGKFSGVAGMLGNVRSLMLNYGVIKGIQDSSLVDSHFALIRQIHQILSHVEHWSLRHVSRKNNQVVDCLVKMSLNRKEGLQIYDSTPR